MKIFFCCCVQFCFVFLCLAEPLSGRKQPKSSGYILTPHLRVGRRSWDSNPDLTQHHTSRVMRVGRGESGFDENSYGGKRPGSNSGLWFGPRLGRVQKRNIEDYAPWNYIILNGEGPISRQVHYTPRLGRESEEYEDVETDVDVTA